MEFGQSIGHRFLPVLSAFHNLYLGGKFFLFQLTVELLHLTLAEGHNDLADLLVADEYAQGMNDNGRSTDLKELLGRHTLFAGARHAGAKSSGWNDHDNLHNRQ